MSRLRTIALSISLVGSVSAQLLAGSNVASSSAKTATASASVTTSVPIGTPSTPAGTSAAPAGTASVVSIYFPGADQLPYVASLIGQSDGAQTLAISCGPGVDSDTCGFPSSVTVTAGPSTAYVSVANQEATFIYDCKITASTAAVCAETFVGDAAYIATTSGTGAASGSTSSVLTESLAASDITWMPITITDWGKGGKPTAMPTPNPTGPNPPPSQPSPDAGNNPWANAGVGSASPPVAGQPTAPIAPMGSSNGSYPGSPTGVKPATWTGAANKLGALGNYAAGLLALAGMAL